MPFDELLAKVERERTLLNAKFEELVSAVKRQEAEQGASAGPGPEVRRLTKELQALHARFTRIYERLSDAAGVDEAELEALEREGLPPYDERWWQQQIVSTPPSDYLDEFTPVALAALLDRVDPAWLKAQSAMSYRLDAAYLSSPLHLVGGVRIRPSGCPPTPQRYAHMLLVARDHLDKRADLDFFAAATFVPELTVLGTRVQLLEALGPVAKAKFARLSELVDEEVPSTIYELLVGTACVAKGRSLEMLAASGAAKSPDFRVHDMGAPAVIECKRRQGLSSYELQEAAAVQVLYDALKPFVRAEGLHGSLEVEFAQPVQQVEAHHFVEPIRQQISQVADTARTSVPWGHFAYSRLAFGGSTQDTRLYSPDFLQAVFNWLPTGNDFDGLLCEVEPPSAIRVREFRMPFCLKWRSTSSAAITKKARGVTSLWAAAAKQIPAGEVGFVYIAYPEGQRAEIADARTRYILASSSKLWHRWSIRIPVTVISRLYARPLGVGVPDLIESALPGVTPGEEHWLAKLPGRVFGSGAAVV